jgi:hypothetical protein
MTVLFVIPDCLGIRNFLHSRVLEILIQKGNQVAVWHTFDEQVLAQMQLHPSVRFHRLPAWREGVIERLLREAKVYAQLVRFCQRDNNILALRQRFRAAGGTQKKIIALAAFLLGCLFSGRHGSGRLARWHSRAARANNLVAFRQTLMDVNPNLVFCTHQRAAYAVPCLEVARELKIPTATFVYSWDNPPKGRMAVSADFYFAWSKHMAAELMTYCPDITERQIKITGTPQFEPYFNPDLTISREEFCRNNGLDAARPIVCFSGGDSITSPYDHHYLADVANELTHWPQATAPQLIFRPIPADLSTRYDSVVASNPAIAVSKPRWRMPEGEASWEGVIPLREDSALLANLVTYCDAVINLGSTMGLDFAMKGKPAININYNTQGVDEARWTIRDYYRVPHFKTVHQLNPVFWINSRAEIRQVLAQALGGVEEKKLAREKWKETLVQHPPELASERIVRAMEDIILLPR